MGINLLRELGIDETSVEAKKARDAAHVYADVIDSLVSCRTESGLKQKDVAKRMGTQQSTVSDLENASSDARFSTLIRYAQAVGCEVHIEITPPGKAIRSANPDWVTVSMQSSAGIRAFDSVRSVWQKHSAQAVIVGDADRKYSYELLGAIA